MVNKFGSEKSDLVRQILSIKGLSPRQKQELEELTRNAVENFLPKARTNFDIVTFVQEEVEKSDLDSNDTYVIDDSDGTAFALVRKGKDTTSLRIVSTHTDMPNLILTPRPINFTTTDQYRDLHIGPTLTVRDNGHISPHNWPGSNVFIRGWTVVNGKRKIIEIPAYIPDISAHVDPRFEGELEYDEAFSIGDLKVITGDKSPMDLLKRFNFESEDDFAKSRFFVIPEVNPRQYPNFWVSAYGLDDSICNFAALRAILEAKNLEHTAILVGFNEEETFHVGTGSADSRFLRRVIYQVLEDFTDISKNEITEPFFDELLENSYGVGADVTVGPTHLEEEYDLTDLWNGPRMGYGVTLDVYMGDSDNHVSPKLVEWIQKNVIYKAGLNGKYPRFQISGPIKPETEYYDVGTQSSFLTRMGLDDLIDMSIPVAGLHTITSLVNMGDVYAAKRAYQAFFES